MTEEKTAIHDIKLDAIIQIKKDTRSYFNKIRSNLRVAGVSVGTWANTSEIIEMALDAALQESWDINRRARGGFVYPQDVPPIHEV